VKAEDGESQQDEPQLGFYPGASLPSAIHSCGPCGGDLRGRDSRHIDTMKEEMEMPFGSSAAEQKISNLCVCRSSLGCSARWSQGQGTRHVLSSMLEPLLRRCHQRCSDQQQFSSESTLFKIDMFMIQIPY
jgi:hypothetical protein